MQTIIPGNSHITDLGINNPIMPIIAVADNIFIIGLVGAFVFVSLKTK